MRNTASDLSGETSPYTGLAVGTHLLASLAQGSSVASITDNSQSGTNLDEWRSPNLDAIGTLEAASNVTIGGRMAWFSNPLNAVTISGSITPNLRALENNAMANAFVTIRIYKRSSGGTYTLISDPGDSIGTELGTTEAVRTASLIPTSTALADGDRIAILLIWMAVSGSTGFSTTGFFNGAAGATGDTYVSFNETITEYVPPAATPPKPTIVTAQAVARSYSW